MDRSHELQEIKDGLRVIIKSKEQMPESIRHERDTEIRRLAEFMYRLANLMIVDNLFRRQK